MISAQCRKSKFPCGTDLDMTRTVVVPVFGVEAEAQIPEIEILTFKVTSEVVSHFSAYREVRANCCRLENCV